MSMRERDMPRFIANPYIEDISVAAKQVNEEWLKANIVVLMEKILRHGVDSSDFHGGAYVGASGIAYAFLRAQRFLPERREVLLATCIDWTKKHLTKESGEKESRFLLGTLGVYLVSILASTTAANQIDSDVQTRLNEISQFILRTNYQYDGDDEMLAGRAGFLAMLLNFREHELENIITKNQVQKVIDKVFESGRNYVKENKLKVPLMYQYHGREYIGSAHGVMGIIQMLLSFPDLLNEKGMREVVETLEWIMKLQLPNGNIPTKTSGIGIDRGEDELIHWCHGATGFVHLMIVAYLTLNSPKYLSAAEKALNLIWQKGILTKGPGICHGVAGSGYAFLLYYRLTGEQIWLNRAKCFAHVIFTEKFKQNSRTPDRPYSLFEGIAGTLCFLCDLLNPDDAQFPMIPIPFSN